MTLTARRQAKDLSLIECARACGLKIAQLSRIERGMEEPTGEILERLAALLCCTAEDVRAGLPSPEEVEADRQTAARSLEALAAVLRDMQERGLGKGKPGRGEIECPACHKRLAYRVAENGHSFGACETPGCIRWVE